MRALWFLAVVTWAGCAAAPCPEGQALEDGACVTVDDSDTDDTEVAETDETDAVETEQAKIRLEIDVTDLPIYNIFRLRCGTRELLRADLFTFLTTLSWEFDVTPGEACTLDVNDLKGGLVLGGRLYTCSVLAASWEPERGEQARVAEITPVPCVPGCADPVAENYDPTTNLDDGSCLYRLGCTDDRAENFDATATKDDGSCDFGGFAPVVLTVYTDNSPSDAEVTISCEGADVLSLRGGAAWSSVSQRTVIDAGFDCVVTVTDTIGDAGPGGSVTLCDEVVAGWIRPPASSGPYSVEVGSFWVTPCSGCTDPLAANYDPTAKVEDGTCSYTP
jgi:hypothetical protein